MSAPIRLHVDPTLDAADSALAERARAESRAPRPYLGASAIGHSCDRKLWLQFRWALEQNLTAKSIKAIEDGHHAETIMAERLKLVPGIELFTEDDGGQQFGFADLSGHFRGNLDGVIQGLKQSGKTHVWEHKCVNQRKFDKLVALANADESTALEQWDAVYYVQGQVYMHYFDLERHYLTCTSPGGREAISVRTKRDREVAEWARKRAEAIIFSDDVPPKISESPGCPDCRWCDYASLCHETAIAKVSCRTCGHATPVRDGDGGSWRCELLDKTLPYADQLVGCRSHMYHPHLLANVAEPVEFYPKLGAIKYRMKSNGKEFQNGYRGDQTPAGVYLSVEIRAASNGCRMEDAALDWLEVIEQDAIAELRERFGAEVRHVALVPA